MTTIVTPAPSTDAFTGSPIYPSQISGLEVVLTKNTTFSWPFAPGANPYPLAAIMDVYTDSTVDNPPLDPEIGFQIILPPANEASPYQSAFIRNMGPIPAAAGTYPLQILKNDGKTAIAFIQQGIAIYLYLSSNVNPDGSSDANGTWQYVVMGAGTSTQDAAALAGAGLLAIGLTLNENVSIQLIPTATYSILPGDRAKLLVWASLGTSTINLPDVSDAVISNGFVFSIANQQAGSTMTLMPAAGQLIDHQATFSLNYGDSLTIVSAGVPVSPNTYLGWYTISGQSSNSSTFYSSTSINLTGQISPYVESSNVANAQIQIFSNSGGALAQPFYIVFPFTRAYEYFVSNDTLQNLSFYVLGDPNYVIDAITLDPGESAVLFVNGDQVYTTSTSQSVTLLESGDGIDFTVQGSPASQITTSGTISLSPAPSVTSLEVAQTGGIIFDDAQTIPNQVTLTAPAVLGADYSLQWPVNAPDPTRNTVLTSLLVGGSQLIPGALAWLPPAPTGVSTITATSPIMRNNASGDVTISLSTVPIASGGTGTTALAGYGAIVSNSAGSQLTSVIPGASGSVLTSTGASSLPTWQTPSAGGVTSVTGGGNISASPTTGAVILGFTGTLSVTQGGTGFTAIASNQVGGVAYGASTNAFGMTTVATQGYPLVANALSGSGNLAPTFQKLGVVGGGTGASTFAAGSVLYGTGGTNPIGATAVGGSGLPLLSGNTGAPTWGTLQIAAGGTGASTPLAAFNALSGMTAVGDLIKGGASGARTILSRGTANQVLTVNSGGTDIVWSSATGGVTSISSANTNITVANPTTTPLLTFSLTPKVTTLEATSGLILDGNIVSTTQTVTLAAPQNMRNLSSYTILMPPLAPTTGQNALYATTSDGTSATLVFSTLPVQAGGTGAIVFNQGGVLFGNSPNTLASTPAGLVGQVLKGTGSYSAPAWVPQGSAGQILMLDTNLNPVWGFP